MLTQHKTSHLTNALCNTRLMSFRLGLLEDESLMRLTLATSLETAGYEVVVQSDTVSDFLAQARTHHLDAVVLDLYLGKGPTGLDAAAELRRIHPDLGVVFLTSFEDPRLLQERDQSLPEDCVYLVKRDVRTIALLTDAIERAVNKVPREPGYSQLGMLSDSQVEMLKLVADGASNAEIAKIRHMTERSVETSISRIAKSLGITKVPDKNQRVHMAKVFFRASGVDFEN